MGNSSELYDREIFKEVLKAAAIYCGSLEKNCWRGRNYETNFLKWRFEKYVGEISKKICLCQRYFIWKYNEDIRYAYIPE